MKRDSGRLHSGIFSIFVLVNLLCSSIAYADFKARAREHYEIHSTKLEDRSEKFRGFSNTINLWYEEPFKISYGIAVGPVLGSAMPDRESTEEFGDKIRLISAGGELKYFPSTILGGTFSRMGSGWSQLRTDGSIKKSNGYHAYFGLGYEVKIMAAGLALEVAYRHSSLQNDITIQSFTPSIGLHFYDI